MRKEIERRVVDESNLMKSAVETAMANSLGKKRLKLWKKKPGRHMEPAVTRSDFAKLKRATEGRVPWTPWNSGRR